jgi:hypothetical protein
MFPLTFQHECWRTETFGKLEEWCKIWGFHSVDYGECCLLGWHCADFALTDISQERIASIFSVEKSASREPALSRNLLSRTPNLQDYNTMKVNACSPFLPPKLLGQCSLSSPGFSPPLTDPLPLIDLPLLLAGDLHHRPYPSPLCWFPMWPSLPLSVLI